MRRSRREGRHGVDSWPAFVDALSTLLLAIIFLLVVFMLGQFFLGQMLEGRDEAVGRLERQMKDIGSELEVQRDVASDLRRGVQRLTQDLRTATSDRDDLRSQLDQAEIDKLDREEQLRRLAAERLALDQAVEERRLALQALDRQLAQLREQLAASQSQLGDERRRLEAGQAEAAKLRADIEALRQVRTDLEARVAEMALQATAGEEERLRLLARLGDERQENQRLVAELADVQNRTMLAQRELEARERRLDELTGAKTALESTLASDRALKEQADAEIRRLTEEVGSLTSRPQVLDQELAGRTSERDARDTRIAELARSIEMLESTLGADRATRDQALADVDQLTRDLAAVNARIVTLDQTLAGRTQELLAREQRIAEISRELNQALASRVQELGQFRSEFFGRLRRVLGDREDIRIVGDRFVFQSEVLFASGESEIGAGGLGEIVKLAQTLRQIASEIPRDLPWVLQVDGHTDRRPINTPRFPSNWELSTARAISVVRALTSQGIPPDRLTARGFAEFQPLETGESEDAFRRNRRIELKLTTR